MDCLILRLDAPLMSFGGIVVDQRNPIERFPGLALLTGLLGNALGWDHRDTGRLQALQARIQFAARWDVLPELLLDYQTVDLGQEHLVGTGWTTRGHREDRGKGKATSSTHIRYRQYWANGMMTLALALEEPGPPYVDALAAALAQPARPLFIGRKPCLPAAPLLQARRNAPSLRAALEHEPVDARASTTRLQACWPDIADMIGESFEVFDTRDWASQIHLGSRTMRRGYIEVRP